MFRIPRPTVVRAFALGLMIGTGIVAGAAVARADGQLDPAELDYSTRWADGICGALDRDHTESELLNIASVIMADGYSADSAADIVNFTVGEWCPRNWPLLVNVGNAYRSSGVA